MAAIYRALEAFAYIDENGNPIPITPGTLVSGDSKAYKGRESSFETVEASVTRATETASAGPGESRGRSKRLTKAEQEAVALDEKTPPQGKKNFDPPPQSVNGPEPEKPGPPVGAGAVNFDPKPQQVDGPENTEPEPTGKKDSSPKPQNVDGGEPSKPKGK